MSITCDNGRNFVGAANELQKIKRFLQNTIDDTYLKRLFVQNHIKFRFCPPRAPHRNGLSEAVVKSAKRCIVKVIGDTHLTLEEMLTLIVKIEATVNSRPLTPMSDDPNDLNCLTPGHFLVGDHLMSTNELYVSQIQTTRLSRWQRIQQLQQHYWKRFYKEYLHKELQRRNKWARRSKIELKIGMMVIIKDDNLPPRCWKLGRVEQVSPGQDGIMRSVLVRTKSDTAHRPAVKLCVLPIEDNED